MYGPLQLTGALLTLVWSCLAYNDYYIAPTIPIQRTKMHQHFEMGGTLRRDAHYDAVEIQTPSPSPPPSLMPMISRSSSRQLDYQSSNRHIDDQNIPLNSRNANRRIDYQSSNRPVEHQHIKTSAYRRGDMLYPDQIKKPNCVHGLCYGTEGYPKDKIQILLKNNEFAAGYFAAEPEESVTLDNRFNAEEETLCETTLQSIFPEKANNTQQVEKLIVNVEGHKQGIVFETCASPKIQCKFHETFPQGYDTSCKQKYVKKKLMVYSESEDEKFVFDTFEVPSCCVCVVKKMN